MPPANANVICADEWLFSRANKRHLVAEEISDIANAIEKHGGPAQA
jgi:hypothetical protein